MTHRPTCIHPTRAWPAPVEFVLQPALHTGRRWRYAEANEVCQDCGERLRTYRVDLRGLETLGKVYRVVFDGDRVREGNGYRLVAEQDGPPKIVLTQSADLAGPVFDIDPPIPCTAVVAAFEDDYPFALVREVGR